MGPRGGDRRAGPRRRSLRRGRRRRLVRRQRRGRQLGRRRERPGEVRSGEGLQVRLHPQADRHRGLRPGERRCQAGGAGAAGRPGPVPRPVVARQLRVEPDRHRDQRHDTGRQGGHDLQLRRRSDRAGRQAGGPGRRRGRLVGFADPVGQGRERLRRPGRLQRDRHGDGRPGARHPRRGRRRVRDPLGRPRRRQPERLDQGATRRRSRTRSTRTSSSSTPSTATTSPRSPTTRPSAWSTSTPTSS